MALRSLNVSPLSAGAFIFCLPCSSESLLTPRCWSRRSSNGENVECNSIQQYGGKATIAHNALAIPTPHRRLLRADAHRVHIPSRSQNKRCHTECYSCLSMLGRVEQSARDMGSDFGYLQFAADVLHFERTMSVSQLPPSNKR